MDNSQISLGGKALESPTIAVRSVETQHMTYTVEQGIHPSYSYERREDHEPDKGAFRIIDIHLSFLPMSSQIALQTIRIYILSDSLQQMLRPIENRQQIVRFGRRRQAWTITVGGPDRPTERC